MRYFAYGSNLDDAEVRRWCRERGRTAAALRGGRRAYLPDHRLAFTQRSETRGGGVLDVLPAVGAAVQGIAFDADPDTMATLDAKETDGHAYRRVEAIVLDDDGVEIPAVTYEGLPHRRQAHVAPPVAYLEAVCRGYAAHGIDRAPLDAAAAGEAHAGPVAHVFVYGTLMRGECRAPVMARHGAVFLGAATVAGTLVDLVDHPGLLCGTPGTVHGELYGMASPASFFAEADAIEAFRGFGVPGSEYRRTILAVRRGDGASAPAWLYVLCSGDGLPRIASGSWRRRA